MMPQVRLKNGKPWCDWCKSHNCVYAQTDFPSVLPEPPPILSGKEAEAFLARATKPPTELQAKIIKEAVQVWGTES